MAGGGESLSVKRTALVLGIGVVIGLVLPRAFDSDPTKSDLRAALEQEVNEGATGQGYDKGHFVSKTVGPVSPATVAFVLDAMVRDAGEDPSDADPKMQAAAACTLLLATGNPMSDEARRSWSSGQGAEELDGDKAQDQANDFYAAAERACHTGLDQRATAGAIGELLVPVAAAAE
jgi:hypothetical protein